MNKAFPSPTSIRATTLVIAPGLEDAVLFLRASGLPALLSSSVAIHSDDGAIPNFCVNLRGFILIMRLRLLIRLFSLSLDQLIQASVIPEPIFAANHRPGCNLFN
jgi:hypothetical protein